MKKNRLFFSYAGLWTVGIACGALLVSSLVHGDEAAGLSDSPNLGKPPAFPLSEAQKQHLVEVVEAWRFPYDPEEKLLLIPHPKPNFKTNFVSDPMHAIRWSLEYSVTLMDTGRPEYQQRAFDIIDTVLDYQNVDPESREYGLWPDFMEISMEDMRRVDGNTADFLGIALIATRFVHGDELPEDLKARMDTSIQHAARSVMRRDITPSYTNPAMMSLLVTLVAGEAYGMDDVHEFGMQKLKKVLDYTKEQGSFNEYNSPNYTTVAINALQQLKNYIRDPEALAMIDELYWIAWQHAAVRFHPPTRQWSGPHSRSYQELLPEDYQAMIDSGLSGELIYTDDPSKAKAGFEHRLVNDIPDDLRHYFTDLSEPREVVESFVKPAYDWMPEVIGTTWLTPTLSLGSVNRGDMWNQRRNLQAYWGTVKKPAYLRTRFMKDDYDFATVNFFSQQDENEVLAALNFSTNGGNHHLFSDAISGGRFSAKNLRLRFEFGGAAKNARIEIPGTLEGTVRVEAGDVAFGIVAPVALIDGREGYWEKGGDGKAVWADLVLYDGPKKNFSLAEMGDTVIGFALVAEEAPGDLGDIVAPGWHMADNRLSLEWDGMGLSVPTLAGPKEEQQAMVRFEETEIQ